MLLPLAGACAAVGAIAMTLAEARLLDVSVGDLLRSDTGRSYLWLLATTMATLVAAVAASRTTGRGLLLATGVAAAAAMLVRATSGHAAALMPSLPSEIAQFVHFLAIGVWIGGLVPLLRAGAAAPTRRGRGAARPGPGRSPVWLAGRCSWSCATGAVRTVGEAGGIGDVGAMLTETSYGTTLIVKVVVALLLIGLGAVNRRRSIPRLATDGHLLRQVVAIELVAALGVLGLTGTLTSLNPDPPADTSGPARPGGRSPRPGPTSRRRLRVTFTATPGTAGPEHVPSARRRLRRRRPRSTPTR